MSTDRKARIKELKLCIADKAKSQFGPSITDVWELIEHFENDNSTLHARIAGLEDGLKPFAKLAELYALAHEGQIERFKDEGMPPPPPHDNSWLLTVGITLGDCRHAAQILAGKDAT